MSHQWYIIIMSMCHHGYCVGFFVLAHTMLSLHSSLYHVCLSHVSSLHFMDTCPHSIPLPFVSTPFHCLSSPLHSIDSCFHWLLSLLYSIDFRFHCRLSPLHSNDSRFHCPLSPLNSIDSCSHSIPLDYCYLPWIALNSETRDPVTRHSAHPVTRHSAHPVTHHSAHPVTHHSAHIVCLLAQLGISLHPAPYVHGILLFALTLYQGRLPEWE